MLYGCWSERIFKREGGDIEQIKAFTRMRDSQDSARYRQLYNIDNNEYQFCDLIIDTAVRNPEQITGLIIEELFRRGLVEPAE